MLVFACTKESCRGIEQVREARKRKIKPFLLENNTKNNFLAASVGSRARLNQAQNLVLVSREPLLYLEFNKPNKQNVSEINLLKRKELFPMSKQLLTR